MGPRGAPEDPPPREDAPLDTHEAEHPPRYIMGGRKLLAVQNPGQNRRLPIVSRGDSTRRRRGRPSGQAGTVLPRPPSGILGPAVGDPPPGFDNAMDGESANPPIQGLGMEGLDRLEDIQGPLGMGMPLRLARPIGAHDPRQFAVPDTYGATAYQPGAVGTGINDSAQNWDATNPYVVGGYGKDGAMYNGSQAELAFVLKLSGFFVLSAYAILAVIFFLIMHFQRHREPQAYSRPRFVEDERDERDRPSGVLNSVSAAQV